MTSRYRAAQTAQALLEAAKEELRRVVIDRAKASDILARRLCEKFSLLPAEIPANVLRDDHV
jgi:hypothetical protein